MGSSKSKEEPPNAVAEADPDEAKDEVQVFWDVHGVLRTKPVLARHKPARELQLVNKLEAQHRAWAPGQTFYLIHTQWLEGWLQFVRTGGAGAPQPAEISNDKLLEHDAQGRVLPELRPGRRSPRHFRLLTEQVWVVYSHLYGARGATITIAAPSEAEAQAMFEEHEAAQAAQKEEEEEKVENSGKKEADGKGKVGFFDKAMNPLQSNATEKPASSDEINDALEHHPPYNAYEDFAWDKLNDVDQHCSIVMVDDDGEEKEDDDN